MSIIDTCKQHFPDLVWRSPYPNICTAQVGDRFIIEVYFKGEMAIASLMVAEVVVGTCIAGSSRIGLPIGEALEQLKEKIRAIADAIGPLGVAPMTKKRSPTSLTNRLTRELHRHGKRAIAIPVRAKAQGSPLPARAEIVTRKGRSPSSPRTQ